MPTRIRVHVPVCDGGSGTAVWTILWILLVVVLPTGTPMHIGAGAQTILHGSNQVTIGRTGGTYPPLSQTAGHLAPAPYQPKAVVWQSFPLAAPTGRLQGYANGVVGNISVGSEPVGVAYDSEKGEVFITNSNSSSVSVISDTSNSVVATVPVGSHPRGVAYDGGRGEVFVTNYNSNSVSVISDTSNSVVATVPVGTNPDGVSYDSGKGETFVANQASNNVSVISNLSNRVVATIPVGSEPTGAAYDSGKGEIFITNAGSSSVDVISDANNSVVASVPVANPNDVAYDSGKGVVFVTTFATNDVFVISDANDSVVADISLGGGYDAPAGIACDSGRGEVFVATSTSGIISVISDARNSVLATVPAGRGPDGVSYDSGKDEVFVANQFSNDVSYFPLQLELNANANPETGPAWLNVTFSASGFGGSWTYSYAWTFGDGDSSNVQNPNHTYTEPGSYSAIITVTDSAGDRMNQTIWIKVMRPLPFSVTLTPSISSVDVGQAVWVNASMTGGIAPYTFAWNDTPVYDGCTVSATSPIAFCLPTLPGTAFDLGVEVTDLYGATENVTSGTVQVYPALRVNLTVSSSTPLLAQTVAFTANASGGHAPYDYAYLGLPYGCYSENKSTIGCLPTQSDWYNVTVVARDVSDGTARATVGIHVIFDFNVVIPASIPVGQQLTITVNTNETFNGSAMGKNALITPHGGYGTFTYTYSGLPPGCIGANVAVLTCTPTQVGKYSVTVSVRDQAGDHATHSVTVKVVPSPGGLFGLSGNDGYYLVAAIAGACVAAMVVLTHIRRGSVVTPEGGGPDAYARYRNVNRDSDAKPVPLSGDEKSDTLHDIF